MASSERVHEVNLEELVEKYVWKRFKEDKGLGGIFYRRSKYYMDIRWGYVDFKHKTTTVERPKNPETKKDNVELYSTEYVNETTTEQQYTFSSSRETTASTKIELQENYTIGAEANLEVDLGGVVTFGGGINGSLSVTEAKGQEYSETLVWNIDTEVKVPARSKATASLYVFEQPSISDFTVETKVTLPSGKLPVSIRRIQDDKITQTYWITNLSAIFDDDYRKKSSVKFEEVEETIIKADGREKKIIDTVVVLTTHGVCRNLSWKNQHVKVQCEEIDGATGDKDDEKAKSVMDGADGGDV